MRRAEVEHCKQPGPRRDTGRVAHHDPLTHRQQLGQNGSTSSAFASLYDYGQGATLHLARSSTRSRLAEAELHTALNYHLVMMASGEIVTPAIPLVFSLNSLISELSASGMGSNPNDTYSAVSRLVLYVPVDLL